MPTYDYECSNCEFIFETFHGINDEALTKCPECGQNKLIRLISGGAAVIVKGTKNPCNGGRKKEVDCPRDKLGQGKFKVPKPFWRDGPVNKNILKNPKKYIAEGKVD